MERRNKRIESLMSRSVTTNNESSGPSDHSLGFKLKQPMHSCVIVEDRGEDQSMDLELYWAATKTMSIVSPMGNTLLHIAASFGNEETVGLIAYHFPPLIKKRNSEGDTALHVAARAGHELTRDVDWGNLLLRVKNEKGNIALHEALMNGHQVVAYYLIAVDPEVLYYLNNEGKSALFLAAEAGYLEFVMHILCDTVGIENTNERLKGKSPIHAAILKRNQGVLDALLKSEPRFIQLGDEEGRTPLHLAASLGYLEEAQYLLGRQSSGAVARDNNGLFPIHLASIKGHVDVVQALLQYWPDSRELLNCHGQNILHVAAKCGGHNMVSYILQTPELEKLINMRDKHGNTPLHLATMDWHPKIVSTLTWDERVDLKLVNNEGMTALDSAEYQMERMPSFRKQLTWTAFKAAGAPRAYCRKALNAKKKQASMQLEQWNIDSYKDRVNTLLLVSTLVATVTFAAGFTIPGGYNNSDPDQGVATMLKQNWFHMFIFCDTIAMYSSIIIAVTLIWAQLGDLNLVLTAFRLALPLLGISLTMMSLSFVSGVYVVVSNLNWLANAVLIMGLVFLTILIALFTPLCIPVSSNYPILRYIFYYPFHLLIFVTRSYTQDDLVEYKSLWWML
ncbi:Protein ACCELERATED CELL DEATH 6 [Camellia lanceoleosa]|uniref:Protein ACCELERATED CELL DEATH 6 n=1 Tax=Camellia lanceoleosa TaxID=1840588 RepID=A0ACC0GZ11_9ERIC|nr:Protein ACCELERATED CELL DEATH 6 [Camellia lanceoleosa]